MRISDWSSDVCSSDLATNKPPVLTSTNETLSLEVGATAIPFATTELSDPENDTLVVTVTLDDPAKGAFSELGDFSDQGSGSYAFTGDPTAATAALRSMVFTPAEDRLDEGESEDVSIVLAVVDTAAATASAAMVIKIGRAHV